MKIALAIANIKYFFEHELSFYLKRPLKKYYIIRRSELGAGFFSNYYWVMGHVVFATKLGYIPVVDMENYPTLYSEDEPVFGVSNAWNYYFENVGKASLEEAYSSKKYVLGEIRHLSKHADKYSDITYRFPSKAAIEYYQRYINENLKIRDDIKQEFDEYRKKIISDGVKTIGVHIRGTDMKNDLGHPMPADTTAYVEAIEKLADADPDVKAVYVATDEKSVLENVKKALEGRLQVVYQEAFRSDIQTAEKLTGIHEQVIDNPRDKHKYLMGKEVLLDAWMLSKCDYLVCGYSNITNTVMLWNNNKFSDVSIVLSK